MTAPSDAPRTTLPQAYRAGGFALMRTPLLPYRDFVAWGDGLHAAACVDATALAAALAEDRRVLRQRLREHCAHHAVQEAIYIASPSLHAQLARWQAQPDGAKARKTERAVVRYFSRMTTRPTPYGLFAGSTLAAVGERTELELEPLAAYRRHTRLDNAYFAVVQEMLLEDPAVRAELAFQPNSSLSAVAGRVRYAQARSSQRGRTFRLIGVEPADYLLQVLRAAAPGRRPRELARALVEADPGIDMGEASAYIDTLIDEQCLVPDLDAPVTGSEPLHHLAGRLGDIAAAQRTHAGLRDVDALARELDARPPGCPAADYERLVRAAKAASPTPFELNTYIQVDLVKPARAATVGEAVLAEILAAAEALRRLAGPPHDPLAQFRADFLERYDHREVPLLEALDEESGVGFEIPPDALEDDAPLLPGLPFAGGMGAGAQVTMGPGQALLLRAWAAAQARGDQEIVLTDADLAELPPAEAELADSIAAMVALCAEPGSDGFTLILEGVSGPSGANLLGRFCHADPDLAERVRQLLRDEEALHPEAIFAEIAHLPEGRLGNILLRPQLRAWEIPFLGRSGAPSDRQIPLADLWIRVAGERIVLRSERLDREVRPRLSSAHGTSGQRHHGIYRFLARLQHQGCAHALGLDLGPLQALDDRPRVRYRSTVLSPMRWRLAPRDLAPLVEGEEPARFAAIQALRARRRLPRYVAVEDMDNVLPVDLDNCMSVDMFCQLVRKRPELVLVELYGGADRHAARGPEGGFATELIVPFTRREARPAPRVRAPAPARIARIARIARSLAPGSGCLYAKIYAGAATADRLIRGPLADLARAADADGLSERWFFVPYSDPRPHVRLRWLGVPDAARGPLLARVHAAVAPWLESHEVHRLQLDTYERELERYGGSEAMPVVEGIFHADSEAAVDLLRCLEPRTDSQLRWCAAALGVDALLDDLLPADGSKRAILAAVRDHQRLELHADQGFERAMAARFRQHRALIEGALTGAAVAHLDESILAGMRAAVRARSARVRPLADELHRLAAEGLLGCPIAEIAASLMHMHVNRVLRASVRRTELVIYELLECHHRSLLARARGAVGEAPQDEATADAQAAQAAETAQAPFAAAAAESERDA